MQAIRIQHGRRVIRGHDNDHAIRKQAIHQTTENHGIGNVRHVEFVETEQTNILGDRFGQSQHGVLFPLVFLEIAMNLLHERVEVQTFLAAIWHRIVKTVHQKTFATPDATPEIHTSRRLGGREQTLEGAAPINFEKQQVGIKILQCIGRSHLRIISHIATSIEQIFIGIEHALRGNIQFFMGHRDESRLGKSVFCQIKRRVRYRNPPFAQPTG